MRVEVKASQTITAKPTAIFKYLTHLEYHQLWNPHLQSIAPLMVLNSGSTYNTTSLMLGIQISGSNTVSKLITNKELEIENSAGLLRYRVNYQLKPSQGKTVLHCMTTVSTASDAFGFTAPVLRLLARRELQSDLQALKIAVEQKLT